MLDDGRRMSETYDRELPTDAHRNSGVEQTKDMQEHLQRSNVADCKFPILNPYGPSPSVM